MIKYNSFFPFKHIQIKKGGVNIEISFKGEFYYEN